MQQPIVIDPRLVNAQSEAGNYRQIDVKAGFPVWDAE
jgi:hypothetical protein